MCEIFTLYNTITWKTQSISLLFFAVTYLQLLLMAALPYSLNLRPMLVHERRLISQDDSMSMFFHLHFDYTDQATSTRFYRQVLILSLILCHCSEYTLQDIDYANFLRRFFSSVPISRELLDSILPRLAECARDMMIAQNNIQGRVLKHIDVRIVVARQPQVVDDHVRIQHVPLPSQVVDLLEKVTSSSDQYCAICLEGFCNNGLKSEIVSIKCSHIFHKMCIAQWLHQCVSNRASYTCPLCRCGMI